MSKLTRKRLCSMQRAKYQMVCKQSTTNDLIMVLNGTKRSNYVTPIHLAIIKLELKNRGII